MTQILLNLMSNAYKYSPDGATITMIVAAVRMILLILAHSHDVG